MTYTTTATVERLAAKIVETWPLPSPMAKKAAATLRALAAERDAALSAGRTMQEQRDAAIARAEAAEAALNAYAGHMNVRPALGDNPRLSAARAEAARMREALERIAKEPHPALDPGVCDAEALSAWGGYGGTLSGIALAALGGEPAA